MGGPRGRGESYNVRPLTLICGKPLRIVGRIFRVKEVRLLGDGTTISFWFDKWLDKNQPVCDMVSEVPISMHDWKVVDCVDVNSKWKLDVLQEVLPAKMYNRLLAYPAPESSMGPVVVFWSGEIFGKFSVSSVYLHLRNAPSLSHFELWRTIWRLEVPERVRSFAWQLMHGKLPTRVYCSIWSGESSDCYHCVGVAESISHVLRNCPLVVSVWRTLVPLNMRSNFFGYPFDDWARYNISEGDGPEWRSLWATTCFFLWRWRNEKLHASNFTRPFSPTNVIRRYVNEYHLSKSHFNPTFKALRDIVHFAWRPAPEGGVIVNSDGAAKECGCV